MTVCPARERFGVFSAGRDRAVTGVEGRRTRLDQPVLGRPSLQHVLVSCSCLFYAATSVMTNLVTIRLWFSLNAALPFSEDGDSFN